MPSLKDLNTPSVETLPLFSRARPTSIEPLVSRSKCLFSDETSSQPDMFGDIESPARREPISEMSIVELSPEGIACDNTASTITVLH